MRQKIMMVSGEASGDMHGAKLAESLYAQGNPIEIFGRPVSPYLSSVIARV